MHIHWPVLGIGSGSAVFPYKHLMWRPVRIPFWAGFGVYRKRIPTPGKGGLVLPIQAARKNDSPTFRVVR